MSAHQVLVFVVAIGLLLGSALALGQLARRLGMPAVVGELCVGVLLGPSVLGHLAPGVSAWLLPPDPSQMHLIDAVGQLGVLLLVGVTGINVDLKLLRRRAGTTAWVGASALLLPLACGVAIGFVLPLELMADGTDRTAFAMFVGVALSVSAIPVIAKTLLEMRLLYRDIGQLIIGTSTIDDIVGWLLLSVVSAMATVGMRADQMLLSVGFVVGALVFCFVVARPVGALLRLSVRSKEPGVVVAVTVLLLLAFAAGTQALGMEAILGALLGGVVIGSSTWLDRERLAALQTFVMAVLAPVFFATAGLRMDLTALRHPAVLVPAVLVLVTAILAKFAGAYIGARLARLGHWDAVALGAGLNARGVIVVVMAIVGLQLGVLTTAMYTIVVLVAIITSLLVPPMLRIAVRHIEVTDEEAAREFEFRLAGRETGEPPSQPAAAA
ncbi:cation:proton antiporter [Actinophytocola sp.]|uniref:cation:proton antiporter n=1 Tax=Actinophytocola sp. TaxID=1872138 RepID=UPI0025B93F7D|nr:cation:proton antiporter [Actinophytocola sp.]